MIGIDSIALRYGSKVLFGGISANINARDRIGLVGSNGMGKSTLLKVLLGEVEADGGRITQPSYVSIGYLPQDGIVAHGKGLYEEVESAFVDILKAQKELDDATVQLHELDTNSEKYADLLDVIGGLEHRLADMEVHRLKSKIEKVLMGLGFGLEDMDRDCGEFSGGWQMRIALAKLLLREPSLLLLDEPTNHLDMQSQRWLESYLKQYAGAMVIISHDVAFLDELTKKTFELTMGNLHVYAGNYSFYVIESAKRKELTGKAYDNQQKKLEKTERFINRFRAKSSKAKQVQSRIKALDKVERIQLEDEETSINFKFPHTVPGGQIALELKDVSKSYGDLKVFNHLNLKVERGERVAIVGVNGAGKSTLAKIITGREPCTGGELLLGHQVSMSYFAQDLAKELDSEKMALEVVEAASKSGNGRQARSILGAFLFSGDDAFKKVKVLSGGERCRLALACLLVQPANCLILDEPTNHLDMKSKRILQQALQLYPGTLIIVSHDRAFLDPIVGKVVEVNKKGIRTFLGNISYYLEKVEGEWSLEGDAGNNASDAQGGKGGLTGKERRRLEAQQRERIRPITKRLGIVEAEIAALEKEKAEWEIKMVDPEFFEKGQERRDGMIIYDGIEKKLNKLLSEWADLDKQLSEV